MTNSNTAVATHDNVDERMVPAKHKGSGIYGEHVARYESAQDIVKGKRVLDIACGSGYGTFALSRSAKVVVGVDVSQGAIDYAAEEYVADNISYVKGDGETIPFPDESFDVVVSFETIEHIKDYRQFMKEVKRVLTRDGVFILSTPNDLEFAEGNHYHLHEFEQDELKMLAGEYYKHIKPYFQATWKGNLIGTSEDMMKDWHRKVQVDQIEPISQNQFLYFYFLCSNRPITEQIQTRFTISQHSSDRLVHEKEDLTNNHISNLEDALNGYREERVILERNLNHYRHRLEKIESNPVWRVLRRLHRLFR